MAKKLENLRDKKPANLHDMTYIDKWFKTFTVYTSSHVTLYFLQQFIAPTKPCFLVTGLPFLWHCCFALEKGHLEENVQND